MDSDLESIVPILQLSQVEYWPNDFECDPFAKYCARLVGQYSLTCVGCLENMYDT